MVTGDQGKRLTWNLNYGFRNIAVSLSYQFLKSFLIFLSVPEEHYHNPLIPPLPGVPVMRRWAHGLAEWGQPSRRGHTAAEGQKDKQSLAHSLGQLPAYRDSVPSVTSTNMCVR